MDSFLQWDGWGALGVAVSVVGSVASVWFAYAASRDAKKAASSAEAARKTVSTVDTVSDLTKILRFIKEMRMRVDHSEWGSVSDLCDDVRIILSGINSSSSLGVSDEFREIATGVAAQMYVLSGYADKDHHSETKVAEPVKIKKILSTQAELVARLLQEVKDKVAEK